MVWYGILSCYLLCVSVCVFVCGVCVCVCPGMGGGCALCGCAIASTRVAAKAIGRAVSFQRPNLYAQTFGLVAALLCSQRGRQSQRAGIVATRNGCSVLVKRKSHRPKPVACMSRDIIAISAAPKHHKARYSNPAAPRYNVRLSVPSYGLG